jgi:hypothetical protein
MTATDSPNLSKYEALLNLALAQIKAIDSRDQKTLDLIIDRKWTIIRGLAGTKELLKTEPKLADIINKIQEADQIAEQKLASNMNSIGGRLRQIKKTSAARHVYGQTSKKKHPILGLTLDDDTPRFIDIKS